MAARQPIASLFATMICVALCLAPALARSQAVVATTQRWVEELHHEAAYNAGRLIGGAKESRPWIPTSDGGFILALNSSLDGGGELLQRYAADGSLMARRTITRSSVTGPIELLPTAAGGAWMLRYSGLTTELIEVSASLEIEQQLSLDGAIVDVATTSDNGLLVLRYYSLERYDASSTPTWRIDADAASQFSQLLVRPDGGSWIAGRSRDVTDVRARVFRYAADGTLQGSTSLPCEGCPMQAPNAFATHPDGGAVMSGVSPPFLARFKPDGSLLWVSGMGDVVAADGISIGADGEIVVRHHAFDRFSGVAQDTGAIRWTVDALFAIPDGDGALAISPPAVAPQRYSLRGIDGSGATQWEQGLGESSLHEITYPAVTQDGAIRFLAWYDHLTPPTSGCLAQPGLLHVARDGNLGVDVQVCSVPQIAWAGSVAISERNQLLISTNGGLESRSENYRLRWRYEPCPDCDTPLRLSERYSAYPIIGTPDGGAWTLEGRPEPGSIYTTLFRLRRISSRGVVERTIDLSALPHFASGTRLLVGSNDAAMLFWASNATNWNQIGWLRVDADGVTSGSIPITTRNQWISLFSARLLDDGDAIVAFTPDYSGSLRPNPFPIPVRTSLLRVSPWGEVRWRYDVPIDHAQTVAISESGVSAVGRSGAPFRIQRIDAQGVADPYFDVMPFDTYGRLILLAPQDKDSIMIATMDGLRRVDRSGTTLHSLGWGNDGSWGATVSPLGLLAPYFSDAGGNAATLLGADDLNIRMVATLDLGTPPGETYSGAVAGGDGIMMMVQSRKKADGTKSVYLAQFAVPGTPAAARIMRDSFEP